jgi:hypothetical protein
MDLGLDLRYETRISAIRSTPHPSRRELADGLKQSASSSDLASVLRIAEGKELNGRGYVSEKAAACA